MRNAVPEDLPVILELLESVKLPTTGVKDHIQNFVLEIHGQAGLLRSMVVNPTERSNGIGSRLVNTILERARAQQLFSVSLLTETAQDYFPRFGFKQVTRAELPESLNASEELCGACPDTAVVMMLEL
jgi:amino-acid N-acetyltransferase